MKRQKRQQQDQRRRGATVVEMALVLPLFVAVVLGIVEFGRSMAVGQVVTNAAREGARLAVIEGTTNADVEQRVLDFLNAAINVDAAQVNLSITVTPAPGNTTSTNEVADAQQSDLVQVRVEIPFNEVSYVRPKYMDGQNLVGRVSMRHE